MRKPAEGEIRAETRLIDRGEIAAGGMASVRRAVDKQIGRSLAMKVFAPAGPHPDEAALRFVQEGQINGQLDHPNIVPVHQLAFDDSGRPAFFTMKLVRGRPLGGLVDERNLASPSERELERLLRILLQVCDAVSFAHSRGVVHLDLKPDNVMVGTHGQVYVMDWGCARVLGAATDDDSQALRVTARPRPREGSVLGTFAYMAPEQALGRVRELDGRTDVFALGAILYRLLTKRPPYQGATYREVLKLAQKGAVRPPAEVVPAGARVSAELARIAMKALAADMGSRHATVDDLKGDLEAFLRGGSWLAQRTYPAGAVVAREGEPGDEAFIVTRGRCEAVKEEAGRVVTLREMGPGAVFGEAALVTSQPRTATLVAREDLTVLVVSRQALEDELCLDSWSGVFVRALAERFRDLDHQLDQARRDARDARLVQWVRERVLSSGRPAGPGRWEASWGDVVVAASTHLGLDEESLASVIGRSPGVTLDRAGGTLAVVSAAGAVSRA